MFIHDFISYEYFLHGRHMIEISVRSIRATFSHFSPVQTSPALSKENTIKEGCLRRGADIYLFQIIPFLVLILQGQCNVTPESPIYIQQEDYFLTEYLATAWSLSDNPLSFKIYLNTKLYGMAHKNFTYWNSDDRDKPELILKALSSSKYINIRILTLILLQLFLLMFAFWLC